MTPHTPDSIHSRALLVWLTIRTWSARKYDRRISADVNTQYNANGDASRVNKFLLPSDNAAYKELLQLATAVRTWHYSQTLAWSDAGERLLPVANYNAYTTELRKRQRAFDIALDSFLDAYPTMRQAAPAALGSMYKPDDYPSLSDLRSRFELSVSYSPLPTFGDVRIDLSTDQIAAIESQITSRIETATETAMQDAWSRLRDVVEKIHERLAQPDAIFRDTLIGNAAELCDSLTRLNVTNDPQLEDIRSRVAADLATADPSILREDATARKAVADKADDILSAMAGLYSVA